MEQLHSNHAVVELSYHDALHNHNLLVASVHDHAMMMLNNHQDHHIMKKKVEVVDHPVHDYSRDADDADDDEKDEKEDGAVLMLKAAGRHFQEVALIRMVDMKGVARSKICLFLSQVQLC